ncbi:MAG: transporter substrate-binding domain-containing protein [Desulfovibrionaceae bacterium]
MQRKSHFVRPGIFVFPLLLLAAWLMVFTTAPLVWAVADTPVYGSCSLNFTDSEKAWLKAHPTIRIGVDRSYEPYESISSNGEYRGVVSDYVRLLAERTGLKLKLVTAGSLTERLNLLEQGEIEAIATLVPTPERKKRMLFSRPYLAFPSVIVVQEDNLFISQLEDLYGEKVASIRSSYPVESLQAKHPQIELKLFDTPREALLAVSEGDASAFVGNLAMVSYTIRKYAISGLSVSAQVGSIVENMCWGVNNENPELVSILDKILGSVTPSMRRAIYDKWIVFPFEDALEFQRSLVWVWRGAALAGGLILLVLLRNFRLRRVIRERMRVEEALRESETRYRSLFEDSPIPLWAEDWSQAKLFFDELRAGGVEDFQEYFLQHPEEVRECQRRIRILEGNRSAALLYEVGDGEQLGTMDLTFIVPDDGLAQAAMELAALAEGKDFYRHQQVNRTFRGGFIQVDLALVVSPARIKDLSRVHVYTVDVTEQMRTEEELRTAKEAADEANRAKSRFLASMSHEIRTPLNAISGMSDLLLGTPLNNVQKDCLQTIDDAVDHLLSVINDILDFSKIEARRLELERLDFDLDHVLNKVLHITEGPAKEKKLHLSVERAEDVPCVLKGDPARLAQVLINLAANAVKFTDKGQVDVSVRSAGVSGNDGVKLWFGVRDSGIGIPVDQVENIFESFRQADGSMSRRFGGTGLGLAIAKQLVELMGGRLEVKSLEGQGSEFFFTVDFGLGSPENVEPAPAKDEDGAPPLDVLLVEDNPANVKVASLQLAHMGHRVEAASNGVEALDLLRRRRFDVVLMDLEMPEMDGLTATRAIRAGEAGLENVDAPIVALTAHAMAEVREQAEEAGVQACITKPVNFRLLSSVLTGLFEKSGPSGVASGEASTETGNGLAVLDMEAARRVQGVDPAMFRTIMDVSLQELGERLRLLRQASQNGRDSSNLRIQAHTLKGTAAAIGAYRLEQAARELDQAAKNGDRQRIAPLMATLESEAQLLRQALERLGETVWEEA